MEEAKIYNKITRLQQEGTVDEYFRNLLVLATSVQDITEEQLLQISIGGMKQSIQSKIKLLDIKDMEQSHKKEKLIEEKKKSQRSSIYIPLLIGIQNISVKIRIYSYAEKLILLTIMMKN